jgi:hypothetical protein
VGEIAARLVLDGVPPEPRFSLAAKATVQQRAVW